MKPPTSFTYSRWRPRTWNVHNIHYPNGACGCVARDLTTRKWRIAFDPRPEHEQPTFKTRDEAALAEWHLADEEAQKADAAA